MECEFDWNDYLESIKSIAVPEELFSHVESSLNNGIKQGMLLEVCHKHNPDVYWISQITMVCGHLLRIKFIGAQTDFWCDISTTKIHPLGWCGKYDELIEPPDEISEKYGDSIIDMMKKALLDGQSVSLEALNNKGLSPIDRIKVGMKVEVQNIIDPYRYWIATVQENVGGRLQLRYDGADEDLSDFWIFFCNPRLASFGFVTSKGTPWQFKFPGKVNKFSCKNKLSTQLRQSAEQSIKEPTPADIFQPSFTWEAHNFVTGMKLEALDPRDMKKIRPATVAKVFNNYHFLVTIDDHHDDYEESKMAWLCNSRHPYIYPIGWAQRNRVPFTNPKKWQDGQFDWDEYLTMTSSVPAPDYCFADQKPMKELRVDMKLEAVNPQNHEDIHVASIEAIAQHMVCIELVTIGEKFWCSQDSDLLFPVGWCDSNNYALHIPDMSIKREPKEEVKKVKKEKKAEEWCDRIYFNYKCYAGPSISRNKLSQLPKHVGPGPLTLVLKEVLNKIISASYKPAKLLKDWETEGPPEEGMRLEMLRAKLKSHTYHAYVPLATKAEAVSEFCRSACTSLQACPALFGPTPYPDSCPQRCQQQDKSVFHNGTERRGRPKGSCNGRRKKKKAAPEKREKEQQPQETESNKDSVESEHSSPSSPGRRKDCKKQDSESENESSASRKHISDVSDSEEPELKKLKFSSHEPLPSEDMLHRDAVVSELRSRLRLPANPLDWSVAHVHRYLRHTRDCRPLADRVRAEHIDGQALVMLDHRLLTDFLHMKKHFADHLCNHITMIRWYYAVNFEDHDA